MADEFTLDTRLSLKAKGLLAMLLDMQEWGKPLTPISSYPTSDKENTINSALNELKKHYYIMDVTELRGNKIVNVGIVAYRYSQGAS